jgi:hypothetical protein
MSKDWMCKRCLHATSTKSNLLSHLRNKNQCSVDKNNGGVNIDIQAYIDELLTVIQEPKQFSCPHCSYQFNHSQSMYRHFKTCKKIHQSIELLQTNEVIQDNAISKNDDNTQTSDELLMLYRKENEILKTQLVQVVFNISDNDNVSKKQYKKKNIPHSVKIKCWNTHVGELIPKVKCLCCHNIDITQHNFHCGHIIAESNGGSLGIDNLLPICNVCNYSMGSTNMIEFRNTYGFS